MQQLFHTFISSHIIKVGSAPPMNLHWMFSKNGSCDCRRSMVVTEVFLHREMSSVLRRLQCLARANKDLGKKRKWFHMSGRHVPQRSERLVSRDGPHLSVMLLQQERLRCWSRRRYGAAWETPRSLMPGQWLRDRLVRLLQRQATDTRLSSVMHGRQARERRWRSWWFTT